VFSCIWKRFFGIPCTSAGRNLWSLRVRAVCTEGGQARLLGLWKGWSFFWNYFSPCIFQAPALSCKKLLTMHLRDISFWAQALISYCQFDSCEAVTEEEIIRWLRGYSEYALSFQFSIVASFCTSSPWTWDVLPITIAVWRLVAHELRIVGPMVFWIHWEHWVQSAQGLWAHLFHRTYVFTVQ